MVLPKFLKRFWKLTKLRAKRCHFWVFSRKNMVPFTFYVFLETSPFWDNYWRWEARILYVASQYTYLKKWCRIFSNFHFFGRFLGRKHGSRCKLVQISWFSANYDQKNKNYQKSRTTFFSTTPGNLHTKFQPHTICGCWEKCNFMCFLMYKMNQVPNIPEIPIYKLYIRYRIALRRPSRKWPELCEKLIFFYTLKIFWKKRSMAIRYQNMGKIKKKVGWPPPIPLNRSKVIAQHVN